MAAFKEEEDDNKYFPEIVSSKQNQANLWNEITQLEPENYENLDDMLSKAYQDKIGNLRHTPKRPMVVAFHHFQRKYYKLKRWIDILYQVALKYDDDSVMFVVADFKDGNLLGFEWSKEIYISDRYHYDYTPPRLYAVDVMERKYEYIGPVTMDKISECARKLHNGTINTIKLISPTDEDAKILVKEVVDENFDESVWQNKKDVFLILYASYCDFAKELLETVVKLADIIKDENIEIVQKNFEVNFRDVHLLRGYAPICYLIPKLNKKSYIPYNLGPETIQNLIKFLAVNATDEMKHYDREGKSKPNYIKY